MPHKLVPHFTVAYCKNWRRVSQAKGTVTGNKILSRVFSVCAAQEPGFKRDEPLNHLRCRCCGSARGSARKWHVRRQSCGRGGFEQTRSQLRTRPCHCRGWGGDPADGAGENPRDVIYTSQHTVPHIIFIHVHHRQCPVWPSGAMLDKHP